MSGSKNLSKNAQKTFLSAVICGTTAFIGGVVGGPVGLGIGSAIGGALTARFIRFRSAPDVIQNDYTQEERQSLLERARRYVIDAKEAFIKILLQMISALLKCRSREELIDNILLPCLKQLAELGVRELLRYITRF